MPAGSMDVAYNRHARRSHPNLNHFSLAPLTSKFPIQDDDEPLPPVSSAHNSSYLEGRSAPTTPSILSRNFSSPRLHSKQIALSKSKSAATLPRSRSVKHVNDPSEWLFRAGTTISSEARESKGQSWLMSRASSTSLVDHEGREETSFADDEYSPLSTKHSRVGSRIASARTSRRGSRVGSKIELLTPLDSRSAQGEGDEGESLLKEDFVAEPDFVDVEEDVLDEAIDDVEVQRLTRQRGFGLGGWVDTLTGWSMFSVTEDEESDGDTPDEHPEKGEDDSGARIRRVPDKRPALEPQDGDSTQRLGGLRDDEGGWQDAAWLLSVATKVLL